MNETPIILLVKNEKEATVKKLQKNADFLFTIRINGIYRQKQENKTMFNIKKQL